MQPRHAPRIDARYWIAITLASVFGADLGDFCSHVLGLGHVRGLPVLAIVFAAIVLAERTGRVTTEAFYWAAIVTLRTAATNLADFATHDLALNSVLFILVLAALLALLARQSRRPLDETVPNASGLYWLSMLVAGTLGTALGDFSADQTGLVASTCGLAAIWVMTLLGMVQRQPAGAGWYWLAIVVIRTFGTNAGDLITGRHGLALGLPASTSVSAAALVALFVLWQPAPRLSAAGSGC